MAKPYQIKLRRTAQTVDTTSDTWTTPDWWKSAQGDTAPADGEPIVVTSGNDKLLAIGSGNDSEPKFFKSFNRKRLNHFTFWKNGDIASISGNAKQLHDEAGNNILPFTTSGQVHYNSSNTYPDNTIGKVVKDSASTLANKADTTYVDDAVSGLRSDVNNLMNTVVKTTTNQNVGGTKTFTTAPKITATILDTSNDTTVATTKFVQTKIASVNNSISGLSNDKQAKIIATGILKGTGNGVVSSNGTVLVNQGGTGLTTASYKNAVVIGNSTTVTNAMQTVRTASGAFYSTGQDAKPSFGTLPVAQGGTGATTATSAWSNLGGGAAGKLGVSSTQSNSNSTVPTSALVYSMNSRMNTLEEFADSSDGVWHLKKTIPISISNIKNTNYDHNDDIRFTEINLGLSDVTAGTTEIRFDFNITAISCKPYKANTTGATSGAYQSGLGICWGENEVIGTGTSTNYNVPSTSTTMTITNKFTSVKRKWFGYQKYSTSYSASGAQTSSSIYRGSGYAYGNTFVIPPSRTINYRSFNITNGSINGTITYYEKY